MAQTLAEQLLDQLCSGAHPRTEASLRLIYAICQEQADRGSTDFSVATIGKLSVERGGPSPGAIRNKTGEKYRVLIAACADARQGHKRKRHPRPADETDEILEGITDPVLRTRIGLMLAELRALRGQVLALRKIAAERAVIEIGPSAPPQGTKQPHSKLSEQQRRTLRDAVGEKTLSHWGWVVDKSGRVVVEDTGQIVFGSGYVPAINLVLESM